MVAQLDLLFSCAVFLGQIMDKNSKKELLDYLLHFVTEQKKEKIKQVIAQRTNHVTVVLEDVFQQHNASAVVRSAECFGVQDVHIIEKRNQFLPINSVAKGSAKWISFYKYDNTQTCLQTLKKKGYKIVATVPHKKSYALHQLPIEKKTALIFGTEATGLSDEAISLADEFVTIPMYGFTESFNVSVSVAICLYDITQRLRTSDIDWELSKNEILDISLAWAKKIVVNSQLLEKKFFEDKK